MFSSPTSTPSPNPSIEHCPDSNVSVSMENQEMEDDASVDDYDKSVYDSVGGPIDEGSYGGGSGPTEHQQERCETLIKNYAISKTEAIKFDAAIRKYSEQCVLSEAQCAEKLTTMKTEVEDLKKFNKVARGEKLLM